MLGKRKREVAVVPRQSWRDNEEEIPREISSAADHDAFRKHFESIFEPLPESQNPTWLPAEDEEEGESLKEESEWEGLSESGLELETKPEGVVIEVVQHQADVEESDDVGLQREQYKSFMVSVVQANQAFRLRTDPLTDLKAAKGDRACSDETLASGG